MSDGSGDHASTDDRDQGQPPRVPLRGRADRSGRGDRGLHARAAAAPRPPSTAASAAPAASDAPSAAPSAAAADSFPPAGDIEKELFMYNWSEYISPDEHRGVQGQVRHHQVPVRHLRQQRRPAGQAPGRRDRLRHRLADGRVRARHGRAGLRPEARQVPAPEPGQHRPASSRACGGTRTTSTRSRRTSGRPASSIARR